MTRTIIGKNDSPLTAGTALGFPVILLALPSFLYLLVTFVLPPPLPLEPSAHLDYSWPIMLTEAFLRGTKFGLDLIYTFGPWGFIGTARGNPDIYPWLLAARLLMACAFSLGTASVASRRVRGEPMQHAVVFCIVIFSDTLLVLPVILCAFLLSQDRPPSWKEPVHHILVVACALLVWGKFTGFVAVLTITAALALQDILRKRWPVISIELLSFAFALWFLARQGLSGLAPFVSGALSIAVSYSREMFVDGRILDFLWVGLFLAMVAVVAGIRLVRARPWHLWPSLIWIALFFFLLLKEAFVRHDINHLWGGVIFGLFPTTLILFCAAGVFRPGNLQPLGVQVTDRCCVAACIFICVAFPACLLSGATARYERRHDLVSNLRAIRAMLMGESPRARYNAALARFQREQPLPRVNGTASIFPDSLALLYANNLSIDLPPIPQAFSAYNRDLSQRNASFYRSARRPDYVFFAVAPIDRRFPASSDSLSWLALMNCYSPAGATGSYLILRASGCSGSPPEFISRTTTLPGRAVDVPAAADGYAIWLEFDMRLNAPGSIVALLWHPPLTEIAVTTGTGEQIFRISPEAGRMGFLLSPMIADPSSFARLYTGSTDRSKDVSRISILCNGYGPKLYTPGLGVRFYKFRLPPYRERTSEGNATMSEPAAKQAPQF